MSGLLFLGLLSWFCFPMKRCLLFALMGCLLAGCSTVNMANPFAEDTFCNGVFGYPPKAIAQILAIENDLPIRPADLAVDGDTDY